LVPFLGAGMSAPRLALWEQFAWNLEEWAGVEHPTVGECKKLLDVRAQRACAKIENSYGRKCLLDAIGCALKGKSEEIPAQTISLAAVRWPLVVSTNYDDLFYGACRDACRTRHSSDSEQSHRDRMDVQAIGRSVQHCKLVLSALHGPFDRQYIWHVQGFLGGQFGRGIEKTVVGLEALQDQLVIGHAEYRRVANASPPHFRRCFGEMFGTRSFLFLGSGLSEEYFLNLFGEVLDLRGPSITPHFAFTKKGEVDSHFLADQMNITVCEYDEHDQLTDWLTCLGREIESPQIRSTRWSFAIRTAQPSQNDLEITTDDVSLSPRANEAIALIAPRDAASNRPILRGAPVILDRADLRYIGRAKDDKDKHVVQYGHESFYAVTARCTGREHDDAVAEMMSDLLPEVDGHNDAPQAVHVQWSSSGGTVPRVFALMEIVRAFGQWRRHNPDSKLRLILHIDSDLAFNLTSGRIDVQELLSSEFIRFWSVVMLDREGDRDREPTRRILYYRPDTKFVEVLKELGVPYERGSSEWSVSVFPCPRPTPEKELTWQLQDRTLLSIGVVFGSMLVLECCHSARCFESAAAG
jgi:hypothetical protein